MKDKDKTKRLRATKRLVQRARNAILKRQKQKRGSNHTSSVRLVKDRNPKKGMTLRTRSAIRKDSIITRYPCKKIKRALTTDKDFGAHYQIEVDNGLCKADFERIIGDARDPDQKFDLYGPFANTKEFKTTTLRKSKDNAVLDYCKNSDVKIVKKLKTNQKFEMCLRARKAIKPNHLVHVHYGETYFS